VNPKKPTTSKPGSLESKAVAEWSPKKAAAKETAITKAELEDAGRRKSTRVVKKNRAFDDYVE